MNRTYLGLAIASLMLLTFAPCASATDIVAHRGASFEAPENTLAAVNLAWELDADVAEVDVHMTSDGKIVVIHDKDTERTAGVKLVVKEHTLAELRRLDVGSWKDPKYAGEVIPTLSEVLATVPDDKRIVIEIKCKGNIVEALEKDLAKSGLQDSQIIVVAFDYDIVKNFKARNQTIEVCWLKKIRRHLITRHWKPSARYIVKKVLAAGLDGADVKAVEKVNAKFVRTIRQAGLKLYVYTVDSPDRARDLIRFGIDGITTNKPGLLREVRNETE